MDTGLQNKVVFVTGGSGAIGQAIAKTYAKEGAMVAVGWYSNEKAAKALVAELEKENAAATAVHLDQGDPASIAASVREVAEKLGPVDVLVGNAVMWPIGEQTWDTLTLWLTTNVAGTMTIADTVSAGMRERGWGRIVLISSDVTDQPIPYGGGYPAAKGAIETAARVLAVRDAKDGVLTNVVRPGFTLTERALVNPRFGQAAIDSEGAKTPTGRICTPEDVASAVIYLGSEANAHINGQVLSVAGGRELTR